MRRPPFLPAALLSLALLAGACSSDDAGDGDGDAGSTTTAAAGGSSATDGAGAPQPLVFNGQGNNLDAYATEPNADGGFATQRIFTNAEDDPDGTDINAQICFFDGGDVPEGETWFIAGEDTGQPDPPQGWGIFRLDGETIGDLEATQVGKLTPTYQSALDNAENYGCGVLDDGRIVTTDVGNQALGPADGQLIVWFPPFDSEEVAYCKIDVEIATAQSIVVLEGDEVLVASARPPTSGIWRYAGDWPTGPDAAGGCGRTDTTGAPLVDEGRVTKEIAVPAGADLLAPSGLAPAPGGVYVSSVITGFIGEYGLDGSLVREVLRPPAGEALTEVGVTYSTGTPLGIGVGPDGTLYYADIGITRTEDSFGPEAPGSVRRITFTDGEPQPPETMADGLAFPDGIGVWAP